MPLSTLHRLTCTILTSAAVLIPASAHAQRAEGSFERTLTVAERPDVEIESGSGGIDVRQGGAGRIEVRGQIRAQDWGWRRGRYSVEERIKRIQANPPVTQTGNVVRIGHIDDDDLRNGVSITYEVIVPATSMLRSKSGSGSQRIEGVTGSVEATSGSGSIVVRRSGGRVRASTGSGGITADAIGGEFDASAGSGSIAGTGIGGAIRAHTSSGGIEVTQTAAGDVDASSSSGSVRVRGVNGGVRASTSSGGLNIEGQMAREWRLSSSSGHVIVDVPGTQGMEVDANSNSGSIDVDFPVTVTGTMGKRTLRGSARGGGPLLHVRTSSGGISIQ
jgi:Putative adhesin